MIRRILRYTAIGFVVLLGLMSLVGLIMVLWFAYLLGTGAFEPCFNC